MQMALGSESSWRTRLVLEERGRRRRRRLEGGIIVAKVVAVESEKRAHFEKVRKCEDGEF